MQNSYANEKVLRFYQNLQFNIYSKPELSAEQIKKNNPIDIYKNLEKILINTPEFKFLDVGCGAGWFANSIKYHFNKIEAHGLDFNKNALKFANEVSKILQINTNFICQDLFNIKFQIRFNLITSIGVLHHTDNCLAALSKLLELNSDYLMIGLYHKYGRKPFLEYFENLKIKNTNLKKNELEELLYKKFIELDNRSDDEKHKKSWFFDQVLHPHETQHTLQELMPLITQKNYQLISTSINKFEKFSNYKDLYEVEKKHLDISKEYLNNKKYYPGFFIIFLKKKSI